MRFGQKIGLSFLILSFLTAATGCIGLLFIYRVMSAFRGVTGESGPAVAGLADLNRYMKQAVTISQEVSADKEIDDIIRLRSELNRTTQEFDRSFNRIRRNLEDELYADALAEMKEEQSQLTEQAHLLIEAIVEELRAENAYRKSLARSEEDWWRIVAEVREVVENLGGRQAPAARQHAAEATTGPPEQLWLLARVQQLLLELRFRLKEYLASEDLAAMPASAELITASAAEVVVLNASLASPSADDPAGAALRGLDRDFRNWAGSLSGEGGLLGLYRRGVLLRVRTDELAGLVQSQAGDSLRRLDDVIALGSRLSVSRSDRGFVTAAPTLLVIAVALTTVLSGVLAFVLSVAITRPVKQLTAATEAVERGDYTPRLQPKAGDELAGLGLAFNRMVGEVRRSHEEIHRLNAGLEQRVQERTTELQEEIYQRQKVEDSLRDSQERYRTLIESFPGGVIVLLDWERRVIALGGQGMGRFGLRTPSSPRPFEELCPGEIGRQFLPRIQAALAGARQEFEYAHEGLEWRVSIVPNPRSGGGEAQTITVLALDVTEAKQAEREMKRKQEQLIQADKLASLGVLVAGVAHEINNPNQAIMMAGQLLRRVWPDLRTILQSSGEGEADLLVGGLAYTEMRQTVEEQLAGIVDSAQRIDAIVRGLKDFARQDREEMNQPVNLNVVVNSALVLLSNMLKRATDRLSVRLDPGLPTFPGNAQRVEQVVVNLVQNACQALKDRQAGIAVDTRCEDAGRVVVLEVRDEGRGIEPQDLPRIKDPFFTTKRETGGTGLGLSVASTIVKEHGGELAIVSRPGVGTTARAAFPVSQGRQRSPA